MSVDIQVNAYGDTHPPPFRGAIMFSGQMSVGLLGSTSNPRDKRNWEAVARVVGCNGTDNQLSCLRAVSADDLIDAMSTTQVTFMPVTDNVTVPTGRAERWRSGENAKVPVLMGTIAQEGRALVNRHINMSLFLDSYLMEPLVTREQREVILDVYRADPELKTDFDVAAAIYTDYFFQCVSEGGPYLGLRELNWCIASRNTSQHLGFHRQPHLAVLLQRLPHQHVPEEIRLAGEVPRVRRSAALQLAHIRRRRGGVAVDAATVYAWQLPAKRRGEVRQEPAGRARVAGGGLAVCAVRRGESGRCRERGDGGGADDGGSAGVG